LFLGTPAVPSGPGEDGEILLPGQAAREYPIAGTEAHVYRIEVADSPVLVTVEQQGIDLVVEVRGPAGQETLAVDSPNSRWGPEIAVLPAGAVGSYRIEVHPGSASVPPGRYTVQAEALPQAGEKEARRTAALAEMSRAGQLNSGPPEAQLQALSIYRETPAVWHELGELRWEAEALFAAAQLEQQSGDLRAAVTDYERSLALWRDLSAPHRIAMAANGLGNTLRTSGETEAARGALKEALALWRDLDESFEEDLARNNLCLLDLDSGVLSTALSCYEELLDFHRRRGSKAGEANVLNSLGGVYSKMGQPDAALDHLHQALGLRQELRDEAGEAQSLNNIATVHSSLGEWQEALRVYDRVRQILSHSGNRLANASLLHNLGSAYNNLGEPLRALTFFEQSLKLRREAGDRRGEVITLNNIGLAWRALGDLEKALDHHRQALERAVELKDRRQEAISRLRLGQARLEQGDPAGALLDLDQALAPLREMGDRQNEVEVLQLRGRALALSGRQQEALPVLQDVLVRRQALRDRAGEAETLRALASAERSLGLLDEALIHARAAVAKVEELRTGFVSSDLRVAFLATRRSAYTLLIDLLMDRHFTDPDCGYDHAAFAVSERARARGLIDALEGAGRTGGAIPAELRERRQSLRRRLSATAYRELLEKEGARAEALQQEHEALLSELDGVEGEIRRHDPLYAALSGPPPVSVDSIAGLLDPGTLLLEYSLGEERSYLWVVGAGGLRSYVLAPEREIEALTRQVFAELSTVEAGAGPRNQAMETLSRILLQPAWSEAASRQRLAVVPDAALHLLPFSALLVPGADGGSWEAGGSLRPLLERQEVVYLPSAATLALQRKRLEQRAPAPQWAAVFADPAFGPAEPAGGLLPQFEPLPSSRREAEAIAALAPAGQVWTALGPEANRDAVLSGQLSAYRFIHFATHGIADARNPELSGLVLSLVDAGGRPRDGFLGLADIYELDLAADLVVLSSCRTAIGREVRGEGLMGLTRGFLYAGVPRVVASLWPVQDRTTAELMSRFYRALWVDRLSPAAALRAAQRSLRGEPRYRDPYSWAGFVLQGDWR